MNDTAGHAMGRKVRRILRGGSSPGSAASSKRRPSGLLKESSTELAGITGLGHVERRLEASSSVARALHDTAVSEGAELIVVGSTHHGTLGHVRLGSVGERLLSGGGVRGRAGSRWARRAREPRTYEPDPVIRVVGVVGDRVAVESEAWWGGDPASAILDAARAGVDLLGLGSRAHGPVGTQNR